MVVRLWYNEGTVNGSDEGIIIRSTVGEVIGFALETIFVKATTSTSEIDW